MHYQHKESKNYNIGDIKMIQSSHIIIVILAVVALILSTVLVSSYKKSQEQFAVGSFSGVLWRSYLNDRSKQIQPDFVG